MFEQKDRPHRTHVSLTLTDASEHMVSVKTPLSNKLRDALNNADFFLDVQTLSGEQHYIAKAAIRTVRLVAIPEADQLETQVAPEREAKGFDPYAVLQIEKGTPAEGIRQAYHRLAKLYHTDKLASYDLPDEVKDYMRAMLVRINLAYDAIG